MLTVAILRRGVILPMRPECLDWLQPWTVWGRPQPRVTIRLQKFLHVTLQFIRVILVHLF
eukprot:COSAG03_NODE_14845_length_450_cov_0.737892_1_plen_59_part_10